MNINLTHNVQAMKGQAEINLLKSLVVVYAVIPGGLKFTVCLQLHACDYVRYHHLIWFEIHILWTTKGTPEAVLATVESSGTNTILLTYYIIDETISYLIHFII